MGHPPRVNMAVDAASVGLLELILRELKLDPWLAAILEVLVEPAALGGVLEGPSLGPRRMDSEVSNPAIIPVTQLRHLMYWSCSRRRGSSRGGGCPAPWLGCPP